MTIQTLANSTIQATYMSDGRVKFVVSIGSGDVASWAAYVGAKHSHGQGSGDNEGYPYFVERILGTDTYTFYRPRDTLYFADDYSVELALQGIGVISSDVFTIPSVSVCKDPMNIGCTLGIPNTYLAISIGIFILLATKKKSK